MSATPTPSPEKKKKTPKDWSKTFSACILLPLAGFLIARGCTESNAATTINVQKDGTVQTVEKGSINNNTAVYQTASPEQERFTAFAEANQAYQNQEYAKAYGLFQSPALAGEPAALVNLGYLYEHGQGVPEMPEEERLQTALSFYKKVDTSAALRGQLSCQIKLHAEDAALSALIGKLLQAEDTPTLNYLAHCTYEEDYSRLSSAQKAALPPQDLSCLYQWRQTGEYHNGFDVPENTAAVRWVFVGINWDVNRQKGTSHPYLTFYRKVLAHIERLDCYQAAL